MKIRFAEIRDIEQLAKLRLEFALFEQKFVPGLSVNTKAQDRLKRELSEAFRNKNPKFFVVEEREELIGYTNIFLYPDFKHKAFMGELFVKDIRRNTGVATALLEFLIKWIKRNKKSIIHTTVSKRNKEALSFFAKMDFKRTKSEFVNLELNI